MIQFLSSDRYGSLQTYLHALTKENHGFDSIKIVDVTGEWLSFENNNENLIIDHYDHNLVVDEIWSILRPHASEWWELLDIDDMQSGEIPNFPGLKDLTSLVYIANQIDSSHQYDLLIIIIPSYLNGLRLLEMAQQGPVLIENLLEPLLVWWDNTKKSLITVESLLRIKLPTSSKLRLTSTWKRKFKILQTVTLSRNLHRFTLIIDSLNADTSPANFNHRLGMCAMHAALPSDLILENISEPLFKQCVKEIDSSILPISRWDRDEQGNILPINITNNQTFDDNVTVRKGASELRIFLPGIDKKNLNIRQISNSIFLLYRGTKRIISLDHELTSLVCYKAQISDGWLLLQFKSR